MTITQARQSIKSGPFWTLVLHFPDGEFGALDASTRAAEALMTTQAPFVVGIYRREQAGYLRKDLARAASPAWRKYGRAA